MQAAMVISGRLEAAKCVGIGFVGLDVCSSQVVVGDAYVGHRAVILLVIGSIGVDDQLCSYLVVPVNCLLSLAHAATATVFS